MAFGDNTLPFPKQVGQQPFIMNGNVLLAVCDHKFNTLVVACHRACFHQPANPHARADRHVFLRDFRWAKKEHNGIIQRVQNQKGRNDQDTADHSDCYKAALLAAHGSNSILLVLVPSLAFGRTACHVLIKGHVS